MAKELIRLDNLCKYYTSGQSVVMGLTNLSVSFFQGEFIAITGESGSGKSTLAHVLGGILPYESGEFFINGSPTSHYDSADWEHYRRDRISFISQNYDILPGSTVLTNVTSALRLTGMDKHDAAAAAEEILKQVELWELRRRRAAKLSSGQKQRLSIARALAKPAPILIADEPTGNLDPENSAKVIELLAQAAKERLVVLITHEFSEAQDHATRHIVIQNGQIAMDAALRPKNEPKAGPRRPAAAKKQHLAAYTAGLQLGGRPVWTALLTAFFALTAFAVFAFLGTFIVNLDDTFTRLYDNSAFRNGSKTRIVVGRVDQQPLTQEDYDKILSLSHIRSLEQYGYVTDVNYAYREGTDYEIYYSRYSQGDPMVDEVVTIVSYGVNLRWNAPYIRTIPLLPKGQTFLTGGRLPENLYEVVAAGDESLIGTKLTVYLQDQKNWSSGAAVPMEVTVVGITDHGSGLYFHTDLGRVFTHLSAGDDRVYLLLPVYGSDVLTDENFLCTPSMAESMASHKMTQLAFYAINQDGGMPDDRFSKSFQYLDLGGAFSFTIPSANPNEPDPVFHPFLRKMIQVTPELFDRLTWNMGSVQASVWITNYAYMDQVLEQLNDAGYIALSPYRLGSTRQDPALAEERKQTLTICLAALAAVVLLQVILLRALFHVQTQTYQILSNIGLTARYARRSMLYQILLLCALGQALGFGAIGICGALGVDRIVDILRYLGIGQAVALSGVHLAASMIAAVWIIRGMSRQVYPLAGQDYDLDLGQSGKEAAV